MGRLCYVADMGSFAPRAALVVCLVLAACGDEHRVLCDDGGIPSESEPDGNSSPGDRPPIAHAGPDQSISHGVTMHLNGGLSSDPDGDPLSYAWTVVSRPSGSEATLVDPTTATPSLTTDLPGTYQVRLVVEARGVASAPDLVVVTATNQAPLATAGADVHVTVGTVVSFDAAASMDPDGERLTFSWTVSGRPIGSSAALVSTDQASTTFTPDVAGAYGITVSVSDGYAIGRDTARLLVDPVVIPFEHDVVDAEYSAALERIVVIADDARALFVVDPETGNEVEVELPVAPLAVSISPSGLEAVVGHDGWITVVDLSAPAITKTIPVSAETVDIVHGGNGWAYVIPLRDQWESIRCVDLANETEQLGLGSIYAGARARRHPTEAAIYLADRSLSPSDIEKHSIAAGRSSYLRDSPYHGDYAMCGDLWFSADGLRIFTACGNVFRSSTNQAIDMTYNGSLSHTSLAGSVEHNLAAGVIAAIPRNGWNTVNDDTRVDFYDDQYMAHDRSIALPPLVSGDAVAPSHGAFGFFRSDGTVYYVILRSTPGGATTRTVLYRIEL
jgi:chitinase